MLFLLLAQAASAAPSDIELHAVISADSLRIEKQGQAKLEVRAAPDAGNLVKVEAPKANGSRTLRNVRVTIDAEARIGAGNLSSPTAPQETAPTAPR